MDNKLKLPVKINEKLEKHDVHTCVYFFSSVFIYSEEFISLFVIILNVHNVMHLFLGIKSYNFLSDFLIDPHRIGTRLISILFGSARAKTFPFKACVRT